MKKIILLAIASVYLVSCSHGITEHFPHKISSNQYSEIWIVRNKNTFGSGNSAKITLDGKAIAFLGIGEFIHFQVTPDVHSVGTPESTIAIPFKENEKYFFLISILGFGGQGFETERIDPQDAKTRIDSSIELVTPL